MTRWPIWVGVILTIPIVGAAAFTLIRWAPTIIAYNEVGDFLAGFVGSVALLWLVLGFFQQQETIKLQMRELALQREELALQRVETARLANEAERQAAALSATEMHARRDTFVQLSAVIYQDLGEMLIEFFRTERLYVLDHHKDFVQSNFDKGNRHAPAAYLVDIEGRPDFEKSRTRSRASPLFPAVKRRFVSRFEFLLAEAKASDPTGVFFDLQMESHSGALYKLLT